MKEDDIWRHRQRCIVRETLLYSITQLLLLQTYFRHIEMFT